MHTERAANERVRVWDLPTRLSHWTIVILFGLCWWSAESDHMQWHLISGYGVLGAVLFRLTWGFCGGQTARFRDFVRGPTQTLRYLRKLFGHDGGALSVSVGHNPLGALSILVMLGLLLTQTVFGLFAVNIDGIRSGPLARWVSFDTGRRFAHWHASNFHLLLLVIGVHLSAIAFYRFKRGEKLIAPMIHGFKPRTAAHEAPYFVSRRRAVLLAVGISLAIVLLVNMPW